MRKGFTLIELLIVIGILGVLITTVLVSLNPLAANKKARDLQKKRDLQNVSAALSLFASDKGVMPANYGTGGACEGTANYDQSMQELVTAGYLKKIPRSPDKRNVYCYYNYGAGNNIGALIKTALEDGPPSTTGEPPSCRPWPPAVNWCNQSSSMEYCICTPY